MNQDLQSEAPQLEPEPPYAHVIFGTRADIARDYVRILGRDSERLGLLGPREFHKIWSRHVAHCGLLGQLLRPPGSDIERGAQHQAEADIIDLGSGAGLPGIPLAIAMPGRHLTLLEPMERRAQWLKSVVAELGLENADVVRERAEEHRRKYRVVTARAVAPLRKLIPLAAPLLSQRLGSELLFIKGKGAEQEILDASKAVQRAKLQTPEVFILGRDIEAEPLTAVRIYRAV